MLKKTTLKLGAALVGTMLGADLIALILFACFGNWMSHSAAQTAYSILAILLLLWMIYGAAWNEGYRDPNRVHYGHMQKFVLKGLIAGCLAEVPYAIVTLLFGINLAAHWNNVWIRLIYFFLHIPYVFVINHFQNAAWLMLLLIVPAPILAGAGYAMGYRQISLFSRLVYKKKKPSHPGTDRRLK